MKKTIYTLNIGNYVPEITNITVPLIKYYAKKINAEYYEITERKFPEWPVAYEKMQLHELASRHKNDWSIYIDIDTIIHPESIDWTTTVHKDTVIAGIDTMFANVMFTYDNFFNRDGRNVAICNWVTVVSDWCLDLWKPLELTPEQSINNIHLLASQINNDVTRENLIDDYAVSRNLAKYSLKYTTIKEITERYKDIAGANFFVHVHNVSILEKIKLLKETVVNWGLKKFIDLNV